VNAKLCKERFKEKNTVDPCHLLLLPAQILRSDLRRKRCLNRSLPLVNSPRPHSHLSSLFPFSTKASGRITFSRGPFLLLLPLHPPALPPSPTGRAIKPDSDTSNNYTLSVSLSALHNRWRETRLRVAAKCHLE
jgi:hypothetical protein